ncbi:MAG: M23 family metallopeptidase, partial [Candidatus Margulisbacteria bacterium]|nr:M23 family metallopeptidase [Candidatus Margulisiibacteriota bacterium]
LKKKLNTNIWHADNNLSLLAEKLVSISGKKVLENTNNNEFQIIFNFQKIFQLQPPYQGLKIYCLDKKGNKTEIHWADKFQKPNTREKFQPYNFFTFETLKEIIDQEIITKNIRGKAILSLDALVNEIDFFINQPEGLPVKVDIPKRDLLGSPFGEIRIDPDTGNKIKHLGFDLKVPNETPVYPTINNGLVIKTDPIGNTPAGKYIYLVLINENIMPLSEQIALVKKGQFILKKNQNNEYILNGHVIKNIFVECFYHLSRILVKPGDIVNRQQNNSESGNTGNSTSEIEGGKGYHLHFGIKTIHQNVFQYVDPQPSFDYSKLNRKDRFIKYLKEKQTNDTIFKLIP